MVTIVVVCLIWPVAFCYAWAQAEKFVRRRRGGVQKW